MNEAADSGYFDRIRQTGARLCQGVAESVTAAADEAQLLLIGPSEDNALFNRYPSVPQQILSGYSAVPVHYYNSTLIQVLVLVSWDHLNDYAMQNRLHAVKYGNKGLVLLMVAKHENSSVGAYSEFLYSIHVSPQAKANLSAIPSVAAISAFNPLGFDDEDGLLVPEVTVTTQNIGEVSALSVGQRIYGLNKKQGLIDVGNKNVSITSPNGKIDFETCSSGIPLPVAIRTQCFTTGTEYKGRTKFRFEIRSWLKPVWIRDFKVGPDTDEHGLMELLNSGIVLGGLSGTKAQAVLGKPMRIP